MNRNFAGIPGALWVIALLILLPLLAGEMLLFVQMQKKEQPVLVQTHVVSPTASPSASVTVSPTVKATPTTPVLLRRTVISPTVSK